MFDRGPVVTQAPDFDRSMFGDDLIVVADMMVAVEVPLRLHPGKQMPNPTHVRVRLLQPIVRPERFAISRREVKAEAAFQPRASPERREPR